jgi:hypothetical protein
MGVVEMSEEAFLALHGPSQAQDRRKIKFTPHPKGEDRKFFLASFLIERTMRLDDKKEGQSSSL